MERHPFYVVINGDRITVFIEHAMFKTSVDLTAEQAKGFASCLEAAASSATAAKVNA